MSFVAAALVRLVPPQWDFARRWVIARIFVVTGCIQVPVEVPSIVPLALHEPTKLPPATQQGRVANRQVVLSEATAANRARQIVHRYFRAVRSESLAQLGRVLSKNANLRDIPSKPGEPALAIWEARFRRFDYRMGARATGAGTIQLGVFTSEQAATLQNLRSFRSLPAGRQLLVNADLSTAVSEKRLRPYRVEFLVALTPTGWAIENIVESHDVSP